MATTTTNFGWDIPQSTDLVKDGATAIAALGSDIDTAFVDLKGGTSGQVLAKASNTDLDFTWVAQDDSNAIQNAIVDAKGDIIVATAADTPTRLAVGANDTVLTADSSTATGLKWAVPVSSGGMTLINTGGTALTGATTTVSSIPDTYKSLYVVVKGVYNAGDVANSFRFNNDSGSNYGYNWMRTLGEVYSAGSLNGTTSIASAFSGSSSTARNTGSMLLEIPRYTDSDWVNFYWSSWSGADGTTTVNRQGVGVYDGSAAISSITFISISSTFSGGIAYVYGVN